MTLALRNHQPTTRTLLVHGSTSSTPSSLMPDRDRRMRVSQHICEAFPTMSSASLEFQFAGEHDDAHDYNHIRGHAFDQIADRGTASKGPSARSPVRSVRLLSR